MGLNATFNNNSNLNARFSAATTFGASIDSTVYVPMLEEYEGPYTVTPSEDTQTLGTEGFHMARDVTINPIPSNYGRITYNGSILTVS